MNKVLIQSGEGELGSLVAYDGKMTHRAIKLRLTRERSHGGRWASAWEFCHISQYDQEVYRNIETGEIRTF